MTDPREEPTEEDVKVAREWLATRSQCIRSNASGARYLADDLAYLLAVTRRRGRTQGWRAGYAQGVNDAGLASVVVGAHVRMTDEERHRMNEMREKAVRHLLERAGMVLADGGVERDE